MAVLKKLFNKRNITRRNLKIFVKFRRVITDRAAEFEVFYQIPPPYNKVRV